MIETRRNSQETGQVIVIIALVMIGLLAIVALAIDGGMLYWNQRQAQNAADAAVLAGVSKIVDFKKDTCGVAETDLINIIQQYSGNNDVPNAILNGNVQAYYLTELSDGNRVVMTSGGTPWRVGLTGTIPCQNNTGAKLVGLKVLATIPQPTFFARLIGINTTTVTAEAYAVWDNRNACTDFAVFGTNNDPGDNDTIKITGAGAGVTGGGMHSNGGMQLGGGGQSICLDPDRPFEWHPDASPNYNLNKINDSTCPSNTDPTSMGGVEGYPLPEDAYYKFDDFKPGGFIWNEVVATYGSGAAIYLSGTGTYNGNDIDDSNGDVPNALIVTEGSISLNNLSTANGGPWLVTIVAKGEISFSGGVDALPIARGVFLYSLADPTGNSDAITVSGSSSKWAGLIYSPNGPVNFSGANNVDLAGMIVGEKIDFSGSNNRINHRPEFCPVNPPKITLIK